MSNSLVLPDAFERARQALLAVNPAMGQQDGSNFSAGIRRGFAVMSIEGKRWQIVFQGNTMIINRPGTNEPAFSIDVVLVDAGPGLSKTYYPAGYVQGTNTPPVCFSHDGVRPDRQATEKQHDVCATCPKNMWGSKVTEQGKDTKACQDNKRLVVLPLPGEEFDEDTRVTILENDVFGGPMLLRIPPGSLGDLAGFDNKMRNLGFDLSAMGTKLAFDTTVTHQKITFAPVRPLTPAEYEVVMEMKASPLAREMLTGSGVPADTPPEQPAPPPQQPVAPPPPPPPPPPPAPPQAPQAVPMGGPAGLTGGFGVPGVPITGLPGTPVVGPVAQPMQTPQAPPTLPPGFAFGAPTQPAATAPAQQPQAAPVPSPFGAPAPAPAAAAPAATPRRRNRAAAAGNGAAGAPQPAPSTSPAQHPNVVAQPAPQPMAAPPPTGMPSLNDPGGIDSLLAQVMKNQTPGS